MKESLDKKEKDKKYQSSFLRDIFSKPNNSLELKIKKWNPKYCGDIDMRIASDGTWFYCGSPISRKKLVKLFSSILIKENNNYFLNNFVQTVGFDDPENNDGLNKAVTNTFARLTENQKLKP